MNKILLTYQPYELKFKEPLSTSSIKITLRNGFLITLIDEGGNKGVGDACPFQEFGSESYEKTEKILKKLRLKLNINLEDIEKSIYQNLAEFDETPALRHGIEQALLNLICKTKNISLNELFNIESRKEVKVNAVVGFHSAKDLSAKIAELIGEGFEIIKIKAGRKDFKEDYESIKAANNLTRYKAKLRIDVNGKWKLGQAITNLKILEEFENIEYIEQPVNSLEDFIELSKQTKIPLAADESIRSINDAVKFISAKSISYIILKPMMLGGLISTLAIINYTQQRSIKPIITSSFESAVGRSFALFAASTIKEDLAHGLDTGKYFAKDIIENPYFVQNGKIIMH
jgi:o-succinylbenzoate synthase